MLGRLVFRSLRSAGSAQRLAGLSSFAETNASEVEQVPSFGYEIPMVHSRKLEFPCNDGRSRKAWVENVDTITEKKLGMIDLHPDVFATPPRIDMIWCNIRWQMMYRKVNHVHVNNRAEMRGGGRKPWAQKGLGKARQGSIRAPQWINGGKAHGPRAPKTDFYMLPIHQRLFALRSMLSIKLAQDDLHIVNAFDFPTNEPEYVEEMVEERLWGPSVLFVDDTDVAPENIALALENIGHMNLMPVYGLNVFSMVKHDTLVLTLAAVEKIEKQILFFMHRTDRAKLAEKFKTNQV